MCMFHSVSELQLGEDYGLLHNVLLQIRFHCRLEGSSTSPNVSSFLNMNNVVCAFEFVGVVVTRVLTGCCFQFDLYVSL